MPRWKEFEKGKVVGSALILLSDIEVAKTEGEKESKGPKNKNKKNKKFKGVTYVSYIHTEPLPSRAPPNQSWRAVQGTQSVSVQWAGPVRASGEADISYVAFEMMVWGVTYVASQ